MSLLLLAFLLAACGSESVSPADAGTADAARLADPRICRAACDKVQRIACESCPASCESAPAACAIFFDCVLDPSRTTCDEQRQCGPADPVCNTWFR